MGWPDQRLFAERRFAVRKDISCWAVAALVALPTSLAAQTTGVAPFVSTNGSLPDSPTLFGISLASDAGALAFRGGTGVRFGGDGFPLPGLADAWVADVDVNIAPTRLWRRRDGARGLEPALLFGIGLQGGQGGEEERFTVPTASYGGAVWYSPASWFRVESEARYRSPLGDPENRPAGVGPGWELRLGAMILWRRGSARPVVARGSDRPTRGRRPGPLAAPDAGVVNAPDSDGRGPIVTRNVAPSTTGASLASSLLGTAADYLGTTYRFGGTDPVTGLDCSAFIQRVYRSHGITLPRTSRQQVRVGLSVDPPRDLQPGDLIFFAGNGSRIDHVALYAGDNTIIHSTSSGGGVVYDDLMSSRGRWFREHMVAARRIIGTDLAAAAVIPMPADGELDPPDRAPPRRH